MVKQFVKKILHLLKKILQILIAFRALKNSFQKILIAFTALKKILSIYYIKIESIMLEVNCLNLLLKINIII